jgi:branched-chain amino acid transport system substrate-binding protein
VIEPGQTIKVGYSGPITGDYAAFGQDMSQAMMIAVDAFPPIEGEGTLYIPRGALVTAVRTMSDFQGIAGTITCQENGECNASGPVLYVIQDGVWTPAAR